MKTENKICFQKEMSELIAALDLLEKEKEISKEVMLETIENAISIAYKSNYPETESVKTVVDRETGEIKVFVDKLIVEELTDPVNQITLADAKKISKKHTEGEIVSVQVKSEEFSRVAAQKGKSIILQKIREEEKSVIYEKYCGKANDVITGVVQKVEGGKVKINLGKVDAYLAEKDMIPGETIKVNDRVRLYVVEVRNDEKSQSPRVTVSRTHPELVKRLFEAEVTEIKDGVVEIKSIAREAGSRTKIAVASNNSKVDPVGSCVGINGTRVGAVVSELKGEKIDIIHWDENPAILIQNALSPAKVVSVEADADEKTAKVIVPDFQLSLAIGKEGQNARLAARLTGFKIDIKSESQVAAAEENYEAEESVEAIEDEE